MPGSPTRENVRQAKRTTIRAVETIPYMPDPMPKVNRTGEDVLSVRDCFLLVIRPKESVLVAENMAVVQTLDYLRLEDKPLD